MLAGSTRLNWGSQLLNCVRCYLWEQGWFKIHWSWQWLCCEYTYWSEPERATHSRVLKMSVCTFLKVCTPSSCGIQSSFCAGRALCCNVKVVSLILTQTFLLRYKTIMVLHEYIYLLWINYHDYEYQIVWVQQSWTQTTQAPPETTLLLMVYSTPQITVHLQPLKALLMHYLLC